LRKVAKGPVVLNSQVATPSQKGYVATNDQEASETSMIEVVREEREGVGKTEGQDLQQL
jgi:hypothetical protein